MTQTYVYIPDLASEAPVPLGGILSRTLHSAGGGKIVLFAFDAGQELSEHTASRPAILHILSGHGRIKLGDDERDARPGTWVYMPAGLVHALKAQSPLTMLLTLLPKE
jgi:quercetin dioxygenase-like cupin family protein